MLFTLTSVGPAAFLSFSDVLRRLRRPVRVEPKPRRGRRRLSPCVGELHADLHAMSVHEVYDALQRGNLTICPETLVKVRRLHGCDHIRKRSLRPEERYDPLERRR